MLTTTLRPRSSQLATLTAGYTALLLIFASFVPAPANADDDDYIFCIMGSFSDDPRTRYYSAIFLGDYSYTMGVENAFHEYLEDEGFEPARSESYCYFEKSSSSAEREFERHVRDDEDTYKIVRTNWAPDTFSAQPLRDFNITISEGQREIRVCVRDHECEDGDRVRVSVNGGSVFYGEIDNDWDCDDVRVQQGRNRVKLFAINGSGNKGNCSYADENTGEIRVEGKNTQTQSWRHRGGAGSSAHIIVEVE